MEDKPLTATPTLPAEAEPPTAVVSASTAAPAQRPWPRHRSEAEQQDERERKRKYTKKVTDPQHLLKRVTYLMHKELVQLTKKQKGPVLDQRDRQQLFKMGDTLAYLAKLEQQLEKSKEKSLAGMTTEEVIKKLSLMRQQKGPATRELVKETIGDEDAPTDEDDLELDGTEEDS